MPETRSPECIHSWAELSHKTQMKPMMWRKNEGGGREGARSEQYRARKMKNIPEGAPVLRVRQQLQNTVV